jgi:hypothetical protein
MLGLGSSSLVGYQGYNALESNYTSLRGGKIFDTQYSENAPYNSSFTISFWLKMTDGQSTAPDGTTNKYYVSGAASSTGQMDFIITNLGVVFFLFKGSGGVIAFGVAGLATMSDGAQDWTHFALTASLSGSGNTTFKVYKNGTGITPTMIATITEANHANYVADTGIRIGSATSGATGSASGADKGMRGDEFMDDFCLHSAALDDDAITAIYNSGTPINLLANSGDYDNSGDVVLYYKFNGAYDSGCITDSHGTSNAVGGSFSKESAT